jgi:drug/metabolite transporter superfamily protein YnfA
LYRRKKERSLRRLYIESEREMKRKRSGALMLTLCVLAEIASILVIILGSVADDRVVIAIGGVGAIVSFFVAAVVDKHL